MIQLTFTAEFTRAPRERLRGILAALTAHLAVAAAIAAMLAVGIAARIVGTAFANRELMEALRQALVRVAQALGMPG